MPAGPQTSRTSSLKNRMQPEGAEHVVEMIAAVEPPHGDHLDAMPTTSVATSASATPARKLPVSADEGRGEIGAQHVERAVRQVDEVHDAEDQRQPGGEQEQQQAELQAVEALLDEIAASVCPRMATSAIARR